MYVFVYLYDIYLFRNKGMRRIISCGKFSYCSSQGPVPKVNADPDPHGPGKADPPPHSHRVETFATDTSFRCMSALPKSPTIMHGRGKWTPANASAKSSISAGLLRRRWLGEEKKFMCHKSENEGKSTVTHVKFSVMHISRCMSLALSAATN